MNDRVDRRALVFLHHKCGHRVPVQVRARAISDAAGRVVGAIEIFSVDTSLDRLQERVAALERLALVDPLTQLPNRRYLETELDAHLSRLERDRVPFGVVFLDIDGFKRFNDEHGHLAGDAALQTVARTLAAAVRSHDTVGRWGGEEFLAVLGNVDGQTLSGLAHRLCRMVDLSRVHTAEVTLGVTVSAGATAAAAGETAATLLARADALMYASKRSGGNRVAQDGEPCAAR
jgi:diguanylate cyclase (GGDEF)-like protein